MRRPSLFGIFLLIFALFGSPREARAGGAGTATLRWETRSFFGIANCGELALDAAGFLLCQSLTGWMPAVLPVDGYGHFLVNGIPIPTRQAPSVNYRYDPALWGGALVNYGLNTFDAKFDVSLFKVGANTIRFEYGTFLRNSGLTFDFLSMVGESPHLLKVSHVKDTAYELRSLSLVTSGHACTSLPPPFVYWCAQGHTTEELGAALDLNNLSTTRNYSLAQLNPALAQSLAAMHVAIEGAEASLVRNAASFENLAEQLASLDRLRTELDELLRRGLDALTAEQLDALLARYPALPTPTRVALVELVRDLKRSIDQMRAEVSRIRADFDTQVAGVIALVEQNLGGTGFDPHNPDHYAPGTGLGAAPDVALADAADLGGFDPAHDEYAALAEATLTRLAALQQGSLVTDRHAFLGVVRLWKLHQLAIERALRKNEASQARWGAFLVARNRVADVLRQYLDDQGWYLDNPVPIQVRALVDGTYAKLVGDTGLQLKDALSVWQGTSLTPDQEMLSRSIAAFAHGLEFIADELAEKGEQLEAVRLVVAEFAEGAARVGLGFVPIVGPAIDFCEAVTGRAFCLSHGQELSHAQRLFSAAGVILPGGGRAYRFWRGVAGAAPGEARVALAAAEFLETELGQSLKFFRKREWRGLRGAAAGILPLEYKAAKNLVDRGMTHFAAGDLAVREVFGLPYGKTIDFISLTPKRKLVLTEVKWSTELGGADANKAWEQLQAVTMRLKELGFEREVARLEIAIPKGQHFSDLNLGIRNGMLWDFAKHSHPEDPATGLLCQIIEIE